MALLRWAGLWLVVLGALLSPRFLERDDSSLWEIRQALAQEASPTSEVPANPTPDFATGTETATAEATPTQDATATETATEVATPVPETETAIPPTETPAESATPSLETLTPTPTETPSVTPTPSPTATSTAIVEVIIGPDGGSVTTYDGNATLNFPAGATNEPLKVTVETSSLQNAPRLRESDLVNVWEFNAYAIDRGYAPVHHFNADIAIDLAYEPDELFGRREDQIRYWYVDHVTERWVEHPVVAVDEGRWRVLIDHFSHQATSSDTVFGTPPVLDAAQVDLNTGGSTYGLPIDVVPGVGKVTPSLSLSYSSTRVDETVKPKTAPSWGGIGWEMSVPYITKRGTGTSASYFLNMNGISGPLVQDGSSNWYLQDHKFVEITHTTSCETTGTDGTDVNRLRTQEAWCQWTVRDQDGVTWTFGATGNSRRMYAGRNSMGLGFTGLRMYQWDLTTVKDLHLNTATYTYTQFRDRGDADWGVVAAYPTSISYPGGSIQVALRPEATTSTSTLGFGVFDSNGALAQVRGDVASCTEGNTREVRALDTITIQATDGAADARVRQYDFDYFDDDANGVGGTPGACTAGDNWVNSDFRLKTVELRGLTGDTVVSSIGMLYEPRTTYLDENVSGGGIGLCGISHDRSRIGQYLTQVSASTGGSYGITYESVDVCQDEEFGRNRVTRIDGLPGSAWTTAVAPTTYGTYTYEDAPTWVSGAFRGHKNVKVTDAAGHFVRHTFIMGNESSQDIDDAVDLAGRELSTKWYSASSTTVPMKTVEYAYTSRDVPDELSTTARWITRDKVTVTTNDGGSTASSETRTYYNDDNGRISAVEEDGVPNTGTLPNSSWSNNDCRRHAYDYYPPPVDLTIVVLQTEKVGSCNLGATTQTDYFYDGVLGAPLSQAAGGRGNLTAVRRKASATIGPEQYVWVRYGYYDNGQLKEESIPVPGDATHSAWTPYTYPVTGGAWFSKGRTVTSYEAASGNRLVESQTTHVFESLAAGGVLAAMPTQTTTYAYTDASGSNARLLGKPASVTAPNGHVTQFMYDNFGRPLTTWQSLDGPGRPGTEYVYNWNGAAAGGVNSTAVWRRHTALPIASREVARYCYDGLGRAMQTVSPYGESATYERTQTILDARGLAINSRMWAGSAGCDGSATGQSSSPNSYVEYDALGRVITTTSSDAGVPTACVPRCVRTKYVGRTTKVTDAEGHRVETDVDGLGRVVEERRFSATDLTGGDSLFTTPYVRTKYEYDGLDNLVKVRQNWNPNGDTSSGDAVMTYDLLGRRLTLKDPDMSGASGLSTSSVYDAAGNLTQQTDPRGEQVISTYDSLNRLRTKKYGSTPSGLYEASYVYDVYDNSGFCGDLPAEHAVGQLIRSVFRVYGSNHYGTANPQVVLDGNSRSCFDVRGREIRRQQAVPNPECTSGATQRTLRIDRTYDASDRVATLTYPDDDTTPADDREVLTYGYDDSVMGAGVLRSLTSSLAPATPYVSNVTYSVALGTASMTFGNGYTTTYTPDSRNRLGRIRTTNATTTAQDLNYEYFENGNVKRIRDDAVTPADDVYYNYDALDRLIDMRQDSSTGTILALYVRNSLDRMTKKIEGSASGVGTMTYGDAQHLHAPIAYNGWTYSYDASGNMALGKGVAFTYDAESRLNRIDDTPSFDTNTFHAYDAAGSRVRKRTASIDYAGAVTPSTEHFMDGLYEEQAWNCDLPGKRTNYIQAFGRTIAQRDTTGAASSVRYLLADHLGSTVGSIEASGTVWTNKYYPYGASRSSFPQSNLAFTGQRREGISTFDPYYFHARFYSTELGHFLSADPLTVDGYNRYMYVRGNPLNATDPTGLLTDSEYDARHTCEVCDAWRAALNAYSSAAAQASAAQPPVETATAVTESAAGEASIMLVPAVMLSGAAACEAASVGACTPVAVSVGVAAGVTAAAIGCTMYCDDAIRGLWHNLTADPSDGSDVPDELVEPVPSPAEPPSVRPDFPAQGGGREGSRVKGLTGPPNSVIRGFGGRVYVTDESGRVVRDITRERAKPVVPGQGFGAKQRALTPEERRWIDELWGPE